MQSSVSTEIINEDLIDNLAIYLKDLSKTGFFGKVEIQFINGDLSLVRKEETFKPILLLTK